MYFSDTIKEVQKMNKIIFLDTLKQSYKLMIIFVCVLSLYLTCIIAIATPEDMSEIGEIFTFVEDYLGVFGIDVLQFTSVLNYTASVFFGVLVMAFTMVFYVMQSVALIAKPVENGSLANTLALPIKRRYVAFTKGVYLIFSIMVLFFVIFIVGTVAIYVQEEFEILRYLDLVAVTCLLCCSVAMMSYFFSVAFCTTRLGSSLATFVPIGFFFMSIIGGLSEETEFLKKFTPFSALDSVGIVTGEVNTFVLYIVFTVIIAVLLTASSYVFERKNLSI